MVKSEPVPFAVGDVVRLVKCQTCGRRVLLPRRDLERRLKLFVARAPQTDHLQETADPASVLIADETRS
jgi:hypothetical protein